MRRLLLALPLVLVLVLIGCETSEDTLVVGLECNYAPFNWTTSDSEGASIDGVNAYCDGYDVDIARTLSEELGLELVIRKIDWDGLIPALNSGDIDVIIAGMSPTPARAEVVNFTDAYFRSSQVLVVRADSDYADATALSDFSGATVIAQRGTLQDDLIPQIAGVNHAQPLDDYQALVSQVSSGISDALVAEMPVAMSIVASNPNLVIVELVEGFVVEESDISVSIALRQTDTVLRDDINLILSAISVETRNDLMADALNRQE